MNHEKNQDAFDESLSAYLDGELSSEDVQAIETEIGKRPEAKARLDELRGVADVLKDVPKVKAPSSLLASVRAGIKSEQANGPADDTRRPGAARNRPQPVPSTLPSTLPSKEPYFWLPVSMSVAAMLFMGFLFFALFGKQSASKLAKMKGNVESAKSADSSREATASSPVMSQLEKSADTKNEVAAKRLSSVEAEAVLADDSAVMEAQEKTSNSSSGPLLKSSSKKKMANRKMQFDEAKAPLQAPAKESYDDERKLGAMTEGAQVPASTPLPASAPMSKIAKDKSLAKAESKGIASPRSAPEEAMMKKPARMRVKAEEKLQDSKRPRKRSFKDVEKKGGKRNALDQGTASAKKLAGKPNAPEATVARAQGKKNFGRDVGSLRVQVSRRNLAALRQKIANWVSVRGGRVDLAEADPKVSGFRPDRNTKSDDAINGRTAKSRGMRAKKSKSNADGNQLARQKRQKSEAAMASKAIRKRMAIFIPAEQKGELLAMLKNFNGTLRLAETRIPGDNEAGDKGARPSGREMKSRRSDQKSAPLAPAAKKDPQALAEKSKVKPAEQEADVEKEKAGEREESSPEKNKKDSKKEGLDVMGGFQGKGKATRDAKSTLRLQKFIIEMDVIESE